MVSTEGSFPLGLLRIILEWRKFILRFVMVSTAIAVVVSLLLPKWYKSTTSLLPPKNQGLGGIGGLSTLLREVAPGAAGGLGQSTETYNYLAILNSRRAAEAMINRFDLMKAYGICDSSIETAIEGFHDNLELEVSEEGVIIIGVYDKDSLQASRMTNYMVDVLNQISIELGTKEAGANREFLERRVTENKSALTAAEDTLKRFQEKSGLAVLSSDQTALASSVAEFYARKIKTEIELSILRKTTGEENPFYGQMELERNELSKKLSTFPELGMGAMRLYRDVLIQQKIMEFIIPLYEQARIEEQKDVPVVLVLDKAVPAEKKARPKRMLLVASVFLSSAILAVIIAMASVRFRAFRKEHPVLYGDLAAIFKRGVARHEAVRR